MSDGLQGRPVCLLRHELGSGLRSDGTPGGYGSRPGGGYPLRRCAAVLRYGTRIRRAYARAVGNRRKARAVACSHDLTHLITAWAAGDAVAGERLWQRVYQELRLSARARIGALGRGATLDTTGLVHESYLRLAGDGLEGYANRKHFYATAAKAMRQIVIDQLRRRNAQQRTPPIDVGPISPQALPWPDELLDAAAAFDHLQQLDARLAQVAELRIFAGLELTEIAALTGQSERTVRRDWQKARAVLAITLQGGDDGHTA